MKRAHLFSACGLLETMRAYQGRIVYFNAHLERLKNSARLLKIKFPYPLLELKAKIQQAVKKSGLRDARVRLVLFKEKNKRILIRVRRYKPIALKKYQAGFRLMLSPARQRHPAGAQLKILDREFYEAAYEKARKKGFDEALILNRRRFICEACRSNIFFSNNNSLFTPEPECGCLKGITRQVIFALAKKHRIRIFEGKFRLRNLYAADEAFLTNSLMGIMPIASVGKVKIGKGQCAKLTRVFTREYSSLLK